MKIQREIKVLAQEEVSARRSEAALYVADRLKSGTTGCRLGTKAALQVAAYRHERHSLLPISNQAAPHSADSGHAEDEQNMNKSYWNSSKIIQNHILVAVNHFKPKPSLYLS